MKMSYAVKNNLQQKSLDEIDLKPEILKNDIGSDHGIFYDLLAAQEYRSQIQEMKPLADLQKHKSTGFMGVEKMKE